MPRLKEKYNKEIIKQFIDEGKFPNVMAIPKIQKIVVNMGVGEAVTNAAALTESVEILETITGQKPVVTKARKAVAAFKLREGNEIGAAVTLRGQKMWEFLDRIISVVMPRTKDFRGLNRKSFDGRGNYSFGIREHTVFPEIDTSKVHKIRSLQVIIVTSATNDNDAMVLLDKFGFPFTK